MPQGKNGYTIIINLTDMNQEEKHLLYHFLKFALPTETEFVRSKLHSFKHSSFPNISAIVLSHRLIKRQRNISPNEFRYEILSNTNLDVDVESDIRPVLATLSLTNDESVMIDTTHHRIAKEIKRNSNEIQTEYEMTKQSGILAIKPPVKLDLNREVLIMNQVGDYNLSDIMESRLQDHSLDFAQRINLAISVLIAAKRQIVMRELIHNDIKPKDIIVDTHTSPWRITFIDFESTKHADRKAPISVHTPEYVAPEFVKHRNVALTFKADIFSLGVVLSKIFGCGDPKWFTEGASTKILNSHDAKIKAENFVRLRLKHSGQVNLTSLFNNINPISSDDKKSIKKIIKQMTDAHPTNRPDLDTIIIALQSILLEKSVKCEYTHKTIIAFNHKKSALFILK